MCIPGNSKYESLEQGACLVCVPGKVKTPAWLEHEGSSGRRGPAVQGFWLSLREMGALGGFEQQWQDVSYFSQRLIRSREGFWGIRKINTMLVCYSKWYRYIHIYPNISVERENPVQKRKGRIGEVTPTPGKEEGPEGGARGEGLPQDHRQFRPPQQAGRQGAHGTGAGQWADVVGTHGSSLQIASDFFFQESRNGHEPRVKMGRKR